MNGWATGLHGSVRRYRRIRLRIRHVHYCGRKGGYGRVIALDIEPEMVSQTLSKAQAAGLSNVVGIVRDFIADRDRASG